MLGTSLTDQKTFMKVILVLLNMDESVCDFFFFFNVGVFCERVKMEWYVRRKQIVQGNCFKGNYVIKLKIL